MSTKLYFTIISIISLLIIIKCANTYSQNPSKEKKIVSENNYGNNENINEPPKQEIGEVNNNQKLNIKNPIENDVSSQPDSILIKPKNSTNPNNSHSKNINKLNNSSLPQIENPETTNPETTKLIKTKPTTIQPTDNNRHIQEGNENQSPNTTNPTKSNLKPNSRINPQSSRQNFPSPPPLKQAEDIDNQSSNNSLPDNLDQKRKVKYIKFGGCNQQNHEAIKSSPIIQEIPIDSLQFGITNALPRKNYIRINHDGKNDIIFEETIYSQENSHIFSNDKNNTKARLFNINIQSKTIEPHYSRIKIKLNKVENTDLCSTLVSLDSGPNGKLIKATRTIYLRGNGVCTCFAVKLLKKSINSNENPKTFNIDEIIKEGLTFYKNDFFIDAKKGGSCDIELALEKEGLKIHPSICVDLGGFKVLDENNKLFNITNKEDLTKAILHFTKIAKETKQNQYALIKNGPESWGYIIHPDSSFIGDSHGKTEHNNGNPNAFVEEFKTNKEIDFIWENSTIGKQFKEDQNKLIAQLNNIYIYWLEK